LRELVPGATRVALLLDPSAGQITETTLRDVEAAAGAKGLQIHVLNVQTSREINAAIASFGRERPDALFLPSSQVGASNWPFSRRSTGCPRYIRCVNLPRQAG
jgi:ABC-type uncharacterized transport system substrate-binding protein